MSFTDIPMGVWREAWAELEEVVMSGGSSKDVVPDSQPDTLRASHWLVSTDSIVFMKAVVRLAYIRCAMKWDGPQTKAVATYLEEKKFPVVRDDQLREGPIGSDELGPSGDSGSDETDERESYERLSRRNQQKFKDMLEKKYGARCSISGCAIKSVLDACHIKGHAAGGPAEPSNGLLLRKDLHKLFDIGLIAVHPEERSWRLHPYLKSHYGDLFERRDVPDFEPDDARLEALGVHWWASQLSTM